MGIYKKMRLDRILVDRGLAADPLARRRPHPPRRGERRGRDGAEAGRAARSRRQPRGRAPRPLPSSPAAGSSSQRRSTPSASTLRASSRSILAPRPEASPRCCSSAALPASSPSMSARDQLHAKLREDPQGRGAGGDRRKDASMPGSSARPVGAIVADVSFISLTKALPGGAQALPRRAPGSWPWSSRNSRWAARRWAKAASSAMQKAGRGRWPRSGRSSTLRRAGRSFAEMPSPIAGGSGNEEVLIGARHGA